VDTSNILFVFGGAFVGWHIVGLLITLIIVMVVLRLLALAFFGHAWGHWYAAGPDDAPGSWHGGWRSASPRPTSRGRQGSPSP
jgi:hypothetical protein